MYGRKSAWILTAYLSQQIHLVSSSRYDCSWVTTYFYKRRWRSLTTVCSLSSLLLFDTTVMTPLQGRRSLDYKAFITLLFDCLLKPYISLLYLLRQCEQKWFTNLCPYWRWLKSIHMLHSHMVNCDARHQIWQGCSSLMSKMSRKGFCNTAADVFDLFLQSVQHIMYTPTFVLYYHFRRNWSFCCGKNWFTFKQPHLANPSHFVWLGCQWNQACLSRAWWACLASKGGPLSGLYTRQITRRIALSCRSGPLAL